MNTSKLSSTGVLKILGCFIFDIALLLIYFKVLGLFFIIEPMRSFLIITIMFIGLLMLNGIIILQSNMYEAIGVPYSVATIFLTVLYVVISNIISFFLIPGNVVWYIFWELVILAAFIITLSIILTFSKGVIGDKTKIEKERIDKTLIMVQLLEIEDLITSKENQEGILPVVNLFKELKERIRVSTPFGRIIDNSAVLEIENQIKNNLTSLKAHLQEDLTENNLLQVQNLLEDARKLVIDRETLNFK